MGKWKLTQKTALRPTWKTVPAIHIQLDYECQILKQMQILKDCIYFKKTLQVQGAVDTEACTTENRELKTLVGKYV